MKVGKFRLSLKTRVYWILTEMLPCNRPPYGTLKVLLQWFLTCSGVVSVTFYLHVPFLSEVAAYLKQEFYYRSEEDLNDHISIPQSPLEVNNFEKVFYKSCQH